jgi:hypothetical protein
VSSTPILDLEKELPRARPRWGETLFALPFVCALWALPFFALLGPPFPAVNWWLYAPALYVTLLLSALGNLWGARIAGLSAGPIGLATLFLLRPSRGALLRVDATWCTGYAYGLPGKDQLTRRHFALWIAGSPLTSLILFAFLLAAMRVFGSGSWNWISTSFWASLAIAGMTVMPFSFDGTPSPAVRLWQLARHSKTSLQWMNLVALHAEDLHGVRPRDWDPLLIDRALPARESEILYPFVQVMASYRSYERDEQPAGLEQIESALQSAARYGGKRIRRSCYLEAASASACIRKNAVQARAWLDRARKVSPYGLGDTSAIDADIAIAEGRYTDALRHLTRVRAKLDRYTIETGTSRYVRDALAMREKLCHEAPPVIPAPPHARPARAPERAGAPEPFPWLSVAIVAILGVIVVLALSVK